MADKLTPDQQKLQNLIEILSSIYKRTDDPRKDNIDDEGLKKIAAILPSINVANQQTTKPLTLSDIRSNTILLRILEIYVHNLAPQTYTRQRYMLQAKEVNIEEVSYLLDNVLELSDMIYNVILHLVVYGKVFVWFVDYSSVIDALQRFVNESVVLEDADKYDFSFKQLRNNAPLVTSRKAKGFAKQSEIDVKSNLLKWHIVHHTRVKVLHIGKHIVGYAVFGNPFKDDLTTPYSTGNIAEVNNLLTALTRHLVVKDEDQINDIKQKLNELVDENVFVIPVYKGTYFEFPEPYSNGLLNEMIPFANLFSLLTTKINADIINERKALVVSVEVSTLSNAQASQYLQQALMYFKSDLVPNDAIIPAMALPKLITPYNVILTPTKQGQKYFNIEQTIPIGEMNPNLLQLMDTFFTLLSRTTGLPPSHLTQETETSLLGALSLHFLEKILTLQQQVNKQLRTCVQYFLYNIHPQLYYNYRDLIDIRLSYPANLIASVLGETISSLSGLTGISSEQPVNVLNVVREILGDTVYQMLIKQPETQNKETSQPEESISLGFGP